MGEHPLVVDVSSVDGRYRYWRGVYGSYSNVRQKHYDKVMMNLMLMAI
jgi:hypothetical protein